MSQQSQSDKELVEELHQYAKQLAYSRVATYIIITRLIERGLDEKRASIIANNLNYEVAHKLYEPGGTTAMIIGSLVVSISLLVYMSDSYSSEEMMFIGFLLTVLQVLSYLFTGKMIW